MKPGDVLTDGPVHFVVCHNINELNTFVTIPKFIVDNKHEKLAPDALEAYRKLGYETLESRAGTYHSGADVVRIMAPSNDSYLVDYIIHEMGHRYWYKFMKSDQRARFNDLVKTNPSEKIHLPIRSYGRGWKRETSYPREYLRSLHY